MKCLLTILGLIMIGTLLATSIPVVQAEDSICTDEIVYGIQWRVYGDRAYVGAPYPEISNAKVTLKAHKYKERLFESPDTPGTYLGAAERPGFYTIKIRAEGYETRVIHNVEVKLDEDGCHVRPNNSKTILKRKPADPDDCPICV